MQRYKIIHRTHYSYSGLVTLGSHSLLLRPREDHDLRIESFALNISPAVKLLWHRDVEGNSVAIANFNAAASELRIESEVIIQQFNEAPLDFIVADYAIYYPFTYLKEDAILLNPYLSAAHQDNLNEVNQWVGNFWQRSERIQTYALLQRLAEAVFHNMHYRVREEPGVQSAQQTLSLGSGSCRDFAWLFMLAARSLGLASRFVSGYLHAPLMSHYVGATHAWAEVYLPGAGWKGFDPTLGKIAGPDHIAVAVSRSPELVPPIKGAFAGNYSSNMNVGVWVSRC